LTKSSRKGSSGKAVSVSSKCPQRGQQKRRSTTRDSTLLPAPGNAPTGTVDNAAFFFQLAFASATGAEQDAQAEQGVAEKVKRLVSRFPIYEG